ncbi:MAG: histidinol-phosphate transaminase [Polyangiaceae bacterium]
MSEDAARPVPRRDWLAGALRTGAAFALPSRQALAAEAQAAPNRAARISVALNENAFGPSPRVIQALAAELHGLERYTGEEAHQLTRQVAQLENVAEEQVVLGEVLEPLGLQLGLQGGPGGEFLYSEPGYTALVDAARPVGGVAVPIPLNARLENDLPAFRARLSARTRAVFLVNPHNPSGTLSEPAQLEAAVSELSKKALVVVDEAYLDYTEEAAKRTLVARVRAGENVIVFRTFSKLHGLAALPFGYAIAPRALADSLHKSGLGSARSLNRLAVRAAAASLRDPGHLLSVRAKVARERVRFHEVLEELKLRHSDSNASFVFFESPRAQPALAAALAAEGIDVGRAFPPLLNWTRISLGQPAENQRVQAALRRALA